MCNEFINNFLSNHFLDTPEIFSFFSKLGVKKIFPKDAIITSLNENIEGVYLLINGITRSVIIGEDGSEKTIFYNTAPCFFNEGPYFSSLPSEMEIHAQTNCSVKILKWSDFTKAMKLQTGLEKELISYFAQKSYLLLNQLSDLLLLSPRQRTLKTVITLAKDPYISTITGKEYILNFSQNDLAKICGLHRVTVSSIISELKKENIVTGTAKGKIMLAMNYENKIKEIW